MKSQTLDTQTSTTHARARGKRLFTALANCGYFTFEATSTCKLITHFRFRMTSVVEFASRADMEDAIRKLDGRECDGRRVRLFEVFIALTHCLSLLDPLPDAHALAL